MVRRVNFIKDPFNLERSRKNADHGPVRLFPGNIAHHALIRYAKKNRDYREQGPLAETLDKLFSRSEVEMGKAA